MSAEEKVIQESSRSNMMAALQSGGNMFGNLYTNWRNRKFTEEQNEIERKRQDAIRAEDRKWAIQDRENERQYNSLQQQMQRLKDAGLNPHLVYGHGAKAQVNAMPRGVSTPSARTSVPQMTNPMTGVNFVEAYYAPKIMQEQLKAVQLDNRGKQIDNDISMQDLMVKRLDTSAEMSVKFTERVAAMEAKYQKDRVKIGMDLLQSKFLKDTANIRTKVEYQKYLEQQYRTSASKMLKDINQAKLDLLKEQKIMLELDNNLKSAGIQPGDPLYLRMLDQLFMQVIGNKLGVEQEE